MAWFVPFVGYALLYGAAGSLAIGGVLRLSGRNGLHLLPLLFTTLTFLALTQNPLPDRATMICPIQSAEPQLIPFDFLQTFAHLYRFDAPILQWITNRTIAAAIMNVILCAVIGAALASHVITWRRMMLFGVGLTLLVEFTQLTGAWGLYPCAWRKFDVDDLIMNVSGVIIGWVWRRSLRPIMRSASINHQNR